MNVLLTGGAGFIGSHTTDALLAKGHRVRILDNLDPQIHIVDDEFPRYLSRHAELVKGDVRDPDAVTTALNDIDIVYHLAAHTGVGQSMYAIRDYVDTNETGTATLLEALLKGRGRVTRVVLASSRAVYGEGAAACTVHCTIDCAERSRRMLDAGEFAPVCPLCGRELAAQPTRETHTQRPVSIYGWTKLHQEQLVRHMAQVLGLEAVILRYFNVIGSRQSLHNPYTGIATVFFRQIVAGHRVSLYERGAPLRDFVSIHDVVNANLLALEAALPSPIVEVNIGSGQGTTIRSFANEIASACGRRGMVDTTLKYRMGDIFACIADLERARAVLAYEPQVPLSEGIREFVEWAQRQAIESDRDARAATELEGHGLLGGDASAMR
jgi:dTDP-L-rhamnose 4-epimerase